MIFFPFDHKEDQAYHRSHQLCHHDGPPDTVDTPYQRQQHDRRDLEHQGPQKGNDGGSQAVIEGGEKAGEENGKAYKQERNGEDIKAMDRQFIERRLLTHKQHGKRLRQRKTQTQHSHRTKRNDGKTLFQHTF